MLLKNARHTRTLLVTVAFALTLFALPATTGAQTVTGTMQGTVTDTNGAFVPGVTVVLRNTETGQERTLTTNDEGFYVASYLPLGRYDVTAQKQGFGVIKRENIEVPLNQTVVTDFRIDPTVSGEVVISDVTQPINTTNQQIAQSLTSQEIQDRPVANQTNFLELATTFTGYQENPTSGQNNPTMSSGSSVNFNGTGSRGATFQINGVNNDDASENQNRQGASLATIKEFQVLTNSFTAEFGRGYGAVVLVQTLSGTNNIRGSVYWFHNDSKLNATRNVFNPGLKKPVNRRNQFGFTTGFPIIKNRLFGFVSLDHTENTGAQTYTRDIFLPSERDPSNWFRQTPANDTPANRAFIQSVLERFPTTLIPNDPRTPRTYVGESHFDFPDRDYSGRLDWNPRQSDMVFARMQYTRQWRRPEDIIIGEQAFQNNKQQNLGVTWTHIFTPTTVGEFRYGLGLRTTLVDIAAGNTTPVIRFTFLSAVSGSIIGNAGGFPINRRQKDNQFVYNLSTLLRGNHFFKAGTDIRRQQLDDLADNFSRGFWSFNNNCNGINYGSGFNAFLNGCISDFQKGYGPFFLENKINESNFYAEDSWRVRPNLTLNLGARYEYVSAPREVQGRINYGFGHDKDNFEPRVGFAWSPGFSDGFLSRLFGGPGNSSIRGGYGIFHGRLFQSVFSQTGAGVRFNPPHAFFYAKSFRTIVNTDPQFNPNNLADPTKGFVFVPGPQPQRHTETITDPGLEMPYTQQWNFTIERQLPLNSALRISYTGNRGIGLLRYSIGNLPDINPAGVMVANHPNNAPSVLYANLNTFPANDPRRVDVRGQTLRLAADPFCAGTGLPASTISNPPPGVTCPVSVPLGPLEYSFRVPRYNERRPDPRFSNLSIVSNAAWSYYHGLQVEWTKRLSRGLNFQMAYTFSKAIDTTSEATAVGAGDTNQTGNDPRSARGLSRFHTPHRFTLYGTYRLPFFDKRRDFVGQALGGWQLSMVMKLVSGTPFTVINSNAIDLNLDAFIEQRPVVIDPAVLYRGVDHPAISQFQLRPETFRPATAADFGCCLVGRNTFYSDGVQNFDIGLTKNFTMPFEGHRLMLRADLFNAFNHVQYGFPTSDIASSNFGRILGTGTPYSPRTIQVMLRYTF